MKNYLKSMFPSPALTLALFILPVILSVYFTFTHYSNRFVLEQDINYFDVQNNIFGQFILDQKWLEWFNRFMDFAFWGILAATLLILAWGVSVAKTTFKNHYAQENFANFKQDVKSWHSHFIVVLVLRLTLIVLVLYSILIIIGKQIPQLSASINQMVQQGIAQESLFSAIWAGLAIFIFQFLLASAIKTFKHLRPE